MTGLIDKATEHVAFEECIDDGWSEWTQYAAEGHHDGTPRVRMALMRAIACYQGREGAAALARSATFQKGYMGTAAGVTDYFATDENGRAEREWDEATDDHRQAEAWWPTTWATVR